MKTPYQDNLPQCLRTYSTLRIYPGDIEPEIITKLLCVEPTKYWHREKHNKPMHGWFLSTRGAVESKDSRRHIDWLLDKLKNHVDDIRTLQKQGAEINMVCFWHSNGEQGGPMISPEQMKWLTELDIEVNWNVYFGS